MSSLPDMNMKPRTPESLYRRRSALLLGLYALLNIAAIFGAIDGWRSPATWLFAAAVAAPILGHIWAFLALMRSSDEFLRGLMAKRFIVASGVTMAVYCAWGFMELYAHAAHLPGALIVAVFWGAFGVAMPLVQTSH